MLQQTRVDTGIPKWHAFQSTFPTVADLAQASEDDVMKAWEGLGYYRTGPDSSTKRPRSFTMQARFPARMRTGSRCLASVRTRPLPLRPLDSGEPVAAVDGNVQRVAARWNAMPLPVDAPQGAKASSHCRRLASPPTIQATTTRPSWKWARWSAPPSALNATTVPSRTRVTAHNEALWVPASGQKTQEKSEAWDFTWHVVTHGDRRCHGAASF